MTELNKIEYKTPSGKLALTLIKTVNNPQPIAKMIRPAILVGLVTGSVAIKTAPNITPPVNR